MPGFDCDGGGSADNRSRFGPLAEQMVGANVTKAPHGAHCAFQPVQRLVATGCRSARVATHTRVKLGLHHAKNPTPSCLATTTAVGMDGTKQCAFR